MIPISFSWDTQKRRISLRWNGIGSWEYREGGGEIKVFKFPIPVQIQMDREKLSNLRVLVRWNYLKGIFSLLKDLKALRIEATVSLPDPMVNGLLYGGWAMFQEGARRKGIDGTVNFLGQNWCKGEVSLSLRDGIIHFKKWVFPMLLEIRRKGRRKEE